MKRKTSVLLAVGLMLTSCAVFAAESSGVVATVKHDGKAVGHEVATGAKKVGKAIVHGAKAVGHGAKEAGKAVVHGVKAVGHGVVEGAHDLKKKVDPTATQPPAPVEQGTQ